MRKWNPQFPHGSSAGKEDAEPSKTSDLSALSWLKTISSLSEYSMAERFTNMTPKGIRRLRNRRSDVGDREKSSAGLSVSPRAKRSRTSRDNHIDERFPTKVIFPTTKISTKVNHDKYLTAKRQNIDTELFSRYLADHFLGLRKKNLQRREKKYALLHPNITSSELCVKSTPDDHHGISNFEQIQTTTPVRSSRLGCRKQRANKHPERYLQQCERSSQEFSDKFKRPKTLFLQSYITAQTGDSRKSSQPPTLTELPKTCDAKSVMIHCAEQGLDIRPYVSQELRSSFDDQSVAKQSLGYTRSRHISAVPALSVSTSERYGTVADNYYPDLFASEQSQSPTRKRLTEVILLKSPADKCTFLDLQSSDPKRYAGAYGKLSMKLVRQKRMREVDIYLTKHEKDTTGGHISTHSGAKSPSSILLRKSLLSGTVRYTVPREGILRYPQHVCDELGRLSRELPVSPIYERRRHFYDTIDEEEEEEEEREDHSNLSAVPAKRTKPGVDASHNLSSLPPHTWSEGLTRDNCSIFREEIELISPKKEHRRIEDVSNGTSFSIQHKTLRQMSGSQTFLAGSSARTSRHFMPAGDFRHISGRALSPSRSFMGTGEMSHRKPSDVARKNLMFNAFDAFNVSYRQVMDEFGCSSPLTKKTMARGKEKIKMAGATLPDFSTVHAKPKHDISHESFTTEHLILSPIRTTSRRKYSSVKCAERDQRSSYPSSEQRVGAEAQQTNPKFEQSRETVQGDISHSSPFISSAIHDPSDLSDEPSAKLRVQSPPSRHARLINNCTFSAMQRKGLDVNSLNPLSEHVRLFDESLMTRKEYFTKGSEQRHVESFPGTGEKSFTKRQRNVYPDLQYSAFSAQSRPPLPPAREPRVNDEEAPFVRQVNLDLQYSEPSSNQVADAAGVLLTDVTGKTILRCARKKQETESLSGMTSAVAWKTVDDSWHDELFSAQSQSRAFDGKETVGVKKFPVAQHTEIGVQSSISPTRNVAGETLVHLIRKKSAWRAKFPGHEHGIDWPSEESHDLVGSSERLPTTLLRKQAQKRKECYLSEKLSHESSQLTPKRASDIELISDLEKERFYRNCTLNVSNAEQHKYYDTNCLYSLLPRKPPSLEKSTSVKTHSLLKRGVKCPENNTIMNEEYMQFKLSSSDALAEAFTTTDSLIHGSLLSLQSTSSVSRNTSVAVQPDKMALGDISPRRLPSCRRNVSLSSQRVPQREKHFSPTLPEPTKLSRKLSDIWERKNMTSKAKKRPSKGRLEEAEIYTQCIPTEDTFHRKIVGEQNKSHTFNESDYIKSTCMTDGTLKKSRRRREDTKRKFPGVLFHTSEQPSPIPEQMVREQDMNCLRERVMTDSELTLSSVVSPSDGVDERCLTFRRPRILLGSSKTKLRTSQPGHLPPYQSALQQEEYMSPLPFVLDVSDISERLLGRRKCDREETKENLDDWYAWMWPGEMRHGVERKLRKVGCDLKQNELRPKHVAKDRSDCGKWNTFVSAGTLQERSKAKSLKRKENVYHEKQLNNTLYSCDGSQILSEIPQERFLLRKLPPMYEQKSFISPYLSQPEDRPYPTWELKKNVKHKVKPRSMTDEKILPKYISDSSYSDTDTSTAKCVSPRTMPWDVEPYVRDTQHPNFRRKRIYPHTLQITSLHERKDRERTPSSERSFSSSPDRRTSRMRKHIPYRLKRQATHERQMAQDLYTNTENPTIPDESGTSSDNSHYLTRMPASLETKLMSSGHKPLPEFTPQQRFPVRKRSHMRQSHDEAKYEIGIISSPSRKSACMTCKHSAANERNDTDRRRRPRQRSSRTSSQHMDDESLYTVNNTMNRRQISKNSPHTKFHFTQSRNCDIHRTNPETSATMCRKPENNTWNNVSPEASCGETTSLRKLELEMFAQYLAEQHTSDTQLSQSYNSFQLPRTPEVSVSQQRSRSSRLMPIVTAPMECSNVWRRIAHQRGRPWVHALRFSRTEQESPSHELERKKSYEECSGSSPRRSSEESAMLSASSGIYIKRSLTAGSRYRNSYSSDVEPYTPFHTRDTKQGLTDIRTTRRSSIKHRREDSEMLTSPERSHRSQNLGLNNRSLENHDFLGNRDKSRRYVRTRSRSSCSSDLFLRTTSRRRKSRKCSRSVKRRDPKDLYTRTPRQRLPVLMRERSPSSESQYLPQPESFTSPPFHSPLRTSHETPIVQGQKRSAIEAGNTPLGKCVRRRERRRDGSHCEKGNKNSDSDHETGNKNYDSDHETSTMYTEGGSASEKSSAHRSKTLPTEDISHQSAEGNHGKSLRENKMSGESFKTGDVPSEKNRINVPEKVKNEVAGKSFKAQKKESGEVIGKCSEHHAKVSSREAEKCHAKATSEVEDKCVKHIECPETKHEEKPNEGSCKMHKEPNLTAQLDAPQKLENSPTSITDPPENTEVDIMHHKLPAKTKQDTPRVVENKDIGARVNTPVPTEDQQDKQKASSATKNSKYENAAKQRHRSTVKDKKVQKENHMSSKTSSTQRPRRSTTSSRKSTNVPVKNKNTGKTTSASVTKQANLPSNSRTHSKSARVSSEQKTKKTMDSTVGMENKVMQQPLLQNNITQDIPVYLQTVDLKMFHVSQVPVKQPIVQKKNIAKRILTSSILSLPSQEREQRMKRLKSRIKQNEIKKQLEEASRASSGAMARENWNYRDEKLSGSPSAESSASALAAKRRAGKLGRTKVLPRRILLSSGELQCSTQLEGKVAPTAVAPLLAASSVTLLGLTEENRKDIDIHVRFPADNSKASLDTTKNKIDNEQIFTVEMKRKVDWAEAAPNTLSQNNSIAVSDEDIGTEHGMFPRQREIVAIHLRRLAIGEISYTLSSIRSNRFTRRRSLINFSKIGSTFFPRPFTRTTQDQSIQTFSRLSSEEAASNLFTPVEDCLSCLESKTSPERLAAFMGPVSSHSYAELPAEQKRFFAEIIDYVDEVDVITLDDCDPYEWRLRNTRIPDWHACAHVLRGSGVVLMPFGFARTGLVMGMVVVRVLAAVCTTYQRCMVHYEFKICAEQKKPWVRFTSTVTLSLKKGPGCLRVASSFSSVMALGFLMDYETVVGYLCIVLIAENIQYIVYSGSLGSINERIVVNSPKTISYLFDPSLFDVQTVPEVCSVESSMRHTSHLLGACRMLNIIILIVATLIVSVGFFDYVKHGDDVNEYITHELPSETAGILCKCLIALGLALSYPLIVYPVYENILETYLKETCGSSYCEMRIGILVLRTTLVLITFTPAFLVPGSGRYVMLFGQFSVLAINMILPVFAEISLLWETREYGVAYCKLWQHAFNILFGISIEVFGTLSSILWIIYQHKDT